MNVLFVIAHDISRRFGCYGDPLAITPHLDELANGSTVFGRHYCHYSLCAPSRTNIFTGCRPATTGRTSIDEGFYPIFRARRPDIQTLPEYFKGHGYHSKALHKVYHEREADPPSWSEPPWFAPLAPAQEWMPDDAECLDRATRYQSEENRLLMKERYERLLAEQPAAATDFKRWRGRAVEGAEVGDDAYPGGKTAARAEIELELLARRQQPFFLAVGFADTHMPWLSPRRYWDLYAGVDPGVLPSPPVSQGVSAEFCRFGNEAYQYFAQDYGQPGTSVGWSPRPDEARQLILGHYAAISYLDAQIGRILRAVERLGLADDTIIVFTTDHGFSLGEHAHWGKNTPHEPDVCVPLLIRAPGVKAARTTGLTEHVDLYPTLCELCDLPVPSFTEGSSLVPLMRRPQRAWKQAVFSHYCGGRYNAESLRSDRYRLTEWRDEAGQLAETELYDYEYDPYETLNRANDPEYQNTVNTLRRLMQRGWEGVRDDLNSTSEYSGVRR